MQKLLTEQISIGQLCYLWDDCCTLLQHPSLLVMSLFISLSQSTTFVVCRHCSTTTHCDKNTACALNYVQQVVLTLQQLNLTVTFFATMSTVSVIDCQKQSPLFSTFLRVTSKASFFTGVESKPNTSLWDRSSTLELTQPANTAKLKIRSPHCQF